METTITIELLIQIGIMIVGVWGFLKVVKEVVKAITDRHDRETKWDEHDKEIKSIKDEMKIQTECIQAILDGLIQLNCDGEVTTAKKRLDLYLNERAHE